MRHIAGALLTAGLAWSQAGERALGIVTSSSGAQLRPAGRNLAVALAPGDLLFRGDTILTAQGEASVAFCPKSGVFTLSKDGEFTMDTSSIRVGAGRVSQGPTLAPCEPPELDPASTRSIRDLARGSATPLPELTPDVNLAIDVSRLDALLASLHSLPAVNRRKLVHGLAPNVRNASAPVDETVTGPTYALVVGISEYEKLPQEQWLDYAHSDARSFADFLASPRGGMLADGSRMRVLTNKEATRDALLEYVQLYLNKAREERGTFVLVMAAHGVLDEMNDTATIVTHEGNPEDLYTSSVPMDELQEMLSEGLPGLGRMLVYVDVCHAANIGSIKTRNTSRAVKNTLLPPDKVPGRILSLVSSREKESSWEGENWGGGHGAFSYFLLRGLNGAADSDANGAVDASELVNYVTKMVQESTLDEQHPTAQSFTIGNTTPLFDATQPGIRISEEWQPLTRQQISKRPVRLRGLQNEPALPQLPASPEMADFAQALRAGNLLPGEAGSAFDILRTRLRATLSTGDYLVAETDLRVALENAGQEVILRYLEGDQVQQQASDFALAGRYFEAAQLLAPASGSIESRALFSRGRQLIFSRNYDDAVRYLERAASIDPRGAYSFNALGIAYLEQVQRDAAKFDLAIAAFQDAILLAPRWVYPRHNLALAYAERGQYDQAIRAYREAMRLGPDYSYLAYNLGLVYQRTNRLNEAERSYRDALAIAQRVRDAGIRTAPDGQWQEGADILNALGSVEASRTGRRNRENAERYYRQAMAADTRSRPARHNLALLLSRDGPSPEAERLWRQNLAEDPADTASRLAWADYLNRNGRPQEAIAEYIAAAGDQPLPGVRRKLASAYLKLNRTAEALAALGPALRIAPDNPALLEDSGDIAIASGDAATARDRYEAAQRRYTVSADKNRVRGKLRRIRSN